MASIIHAAGLGNMQEAKGGRQRGGRVGLMLGGIFLAAVLSAAGQAGSKKAEGILLGGKPGAPVKIEVFSDYQCPMCRNYYLDSLKPLLVDYTKAGKIDKIWVQYHDLPLDSIHPHARQATRFALAALRLGKDKWLKVSDALYMQQNAWSEDGNIEAALAKMLDPTELAQLKKMIADPAIEEEIRQEILLAQSLNVSSTPTTFVIQETGRQQKATGLVQYDVLKDVIDKLTR